jgi:hypothetical protein
MNKHGIIVRALFFFLFIYLFLGCAIALINPNFSHFDPNTQCLIWQEVRLLSEKLKVINIILFYIYAPRYPSNKSPSFTQGTETYTIRFTCHTSQTMC